MAQHKINGVMVTMTLEAAESNDDGGCWRNGIVTLPDGREFSVGGGWILSSVAARHENNCNGLQPEAHPNINWPGAVDAGDFSAYKGYENGDLEQLADAIGLDINRDTTEGDERWENFVTLIEKLSEKASNE